MAEPVAQQNEEMKGKMEEECSEEEEEKKRAKKEEEEKEEGGPTRRIGIIGYGHLGQFLKIELGKSPQFTLKRIWNRTEDAKEGVLPLEDIKDEHLADIDLVIEVAHPDIINKYAKTILRHADLFIGSPAALANEKTYKGIQKCLGELSNVHRAVFIPCGSLWGAKDIQKMADLKILKALSLTMIFHPNALRLPELTADSPSGLAVLHQKCQDSLHTSHPKVLYDGTVRQLCPLAPNNVNSMACAAIAAHNLGFENTRAKLIIDPEMQNWQIVEYEAIGENGFRTIVRRENPAQPGVVTGETTYFSFLSSINETLFRRPGINIC